MTDPIRVCWTNPRTAPSSANSWGYAATNRHLRAALEATGLVTFDDDGPLAFHVTSPVEYRPKPDAHVNVLFTMWESPDLPEDKRPFVHTADLLIVPSQFARDILAPFVRVPIRRVPLGVDLDTFRYVDRDWHGQEPFVWLAVGAPNARKGWDVIEHLWAEAFAQRSDVLLYCKTQSPSPMAEDIAGDHWERVAPGVLQQGNAILDLRPLTTASLAELYGMAHGFLYPTAGEGFGLTLAEALATGLPAVVTRWSGVLDFTSADTVAYVDWRPYGAEVIDDRAMHDPTIRPEAQRFNSALADPVEVVRAMCRIMAAYPAAKRMGKRAAQRIRREFTWARAGQSVAHELIALTQAASTAGRHP